MNMFKPTTAKNVAEYIHMIPEPRRSTIKQLHAFIHQTLPQFTPYLQGSMIGYGTYHYTYATGREGDWCLIGLASQKNYISIYVCITDGKQYLPEKYKTKLPKASIGKSCIRFKKIEEIDLLVLKEMFLEAVEKMKK